MIHTPDALAKLHRIDLIGVYLKLKEQLGDKFRYVLELGADRSVVEDNIIEMQFIAYPLDAPWRLMRETVIEMDKRGGVSRPISVDARDIHESWSGYVYHDRREFEDVQKVICYGEFETGIASDHTRAVSVGRKCVDGIYVGWSRFDESVAFRTYKEAYHLETYALPRQYAYRKKVT